MKEIDVPSNYKSLLNFKQTESYAKNVQNYFESNFARELELIKISAPLLISELPNAFGQNFQSDIKSPIQFKVTETLREVSMVDSLVEWKRKKLKQHNFEPGEGIYSEIITIRPSEISTNINSIYKKQLSWERVIQRSERNLHTLKYIVKKIYNVFQNTEKYLYEIDSRFEPRLPEKLNFFTSEELEKMYPTLTPRGREIEIGKVKKAVFIIKMGIKLADGQAHEFKRPDYDDWNLNGNLMFYFSTLGESFKIGSVGVRVNGEVLKEQMSTLGEKPKIVSKFRKSIMENQLPDSIGGRFYQSRISMFLLRKAHIGEIVPSIWPESVVEACKRGNIPLLD